MNKMANFFKTFAALVVLLVFSCAHVSASTEHKTLLDGKKWSQYNMSTSGTTLLGGNLQGAAYYNGKIYSFRQVNSTSPSTNNYNVYDIESNKWTAGKAITCAPGTHMGSAAFAPNVVSSYTKNGTTYNCTIPFVYVSGHGTLNPDGTTGSTKYIYCAVIDIENNQLITRFAFPNRYDDCILSYDFNYAKIDNTSRVWVLGYPSTSIGQSVDRKGKSPYIIEEYQISNDIFLSQTPSKTEFTHSSSEYKGMMQGGGPNAEGIQESLECGTLQDMFYYDDHLYVCTGRGSEYNRTEYVKVQCYDVTPGNHHVEETVVLPEYGESQGIVYDGANIWVLVTGGTGKMWKYAAGTGYDNFNFQQPAEVSPATTPATYEIDNGSELCWFLQQVYAGRTTINAKLSQNINLSGITLPTSFYVYMDQETSISSGFDAQYAFRGTFNGEGHSINDLSITKTPFYNNGLFPYCIGATIENVTISGTITPTKCRTSAGNDQLVANVGMIGYMDGGTISHVNVEGLTINEANTVSGTVNKLVGGSTGDIVMTNVTGVDAYTITWKDNDESIIKETQVIAGREIVAPADPVKEGYTFKAWNPEFTAGTIATANATYTATYEEHPFDSNGFNLNFSTCAEANKYEAASLVDGWYEIDNAGKLFWFANQVNAGNATINAKVTKDIDMCGDTHKEFSGIGIYESKSGGERKPFSGNFDGQGHRIYNCDITTMGSGYWGGGLIATAKGYNKSIKDFTLEGTVTIKSDAYAGGALGYIEQGYTISGITSSVTITTKAGKTGGVAGFVNTGSISKCRYNGTLTSSSVNVGGIIGETAVNMTDCLFDGKIVSTQTGNTSSCVGGIACQSRGVTIKNCLVYGTITTSTTTASTSMVVGRVENNGLTLTNIYYGAQETSTPTIAYNANDKTVTATNVTPITTQTWDEIKTSLNGSSSPANWGINSQVYPVPGEKDANAKYTITFNTDGGSYIAPIKQEAGTPVTAPMDPSKTGYSFAGWDKAIPSVMPDQDMTITAQWTINQYTISFDMNGATSAQIAAITQDYNTTITKPADPTKTGWYFNGWTPSVPSTMPAEDITCVAQWSSDSYNNGFNTNSSCSTDKKYEEPVQLTADRCAELGIATTYATQDYFEVKNAGNMYWIAQNISNVNNSRKYVMTADIDMDGSNHKDWTGIGAWTPADSHFKGTFDGLGHKFTNYYMNVTSGSYKAIFGVPEGATIKNFSVFGSIEISSTGNQIGVICGRTSGNNTIEDIHSAVNITVVTGKVSGAIGGLVGQCSGGTVNFNRCRYSGTITGNSTYSGLGGIVGNAESTLIFNNCLFDGTIITTSTPTRTGVDDGLKIGGMCGRNNNKTTIKNCLSIGTITVPAAADKGNVGVIFGTQTTTHQLTITNTYYTAISGMSAVGNNSNTDTSSAAPTVLADSPDWEDIKIALNNGSTNWGINSKDYPVPGEKDGVQKYTLTWDTDGGTEIASTREIVGASIAKPTDPTKTGYSFQGWKDASSNDVTFPFTMPAQNTTLTAKWTINQYTITFNTDGGSAVAAITQNYGTTITKPANPTKADYNFSGWNPEIPNTMPAENMTCVALWSQDSYDSNGFNTSSSCATDKKYEAPLQISSTRCTNLGIASTYATEGYYEVKNAGNMFWIAQNISADNNTRKYVVTADINMDGTNHKDWPGISTFSGAHFKGTFDGLGHKFTNYYMKPTGNIMGMFSAPENATIKNFSVSGNVDITGDFNQIGVIAGRIIEGDKTKKTTFQDIHSSVTITVADNKKPISIGGLIGQVVGGAALVRCRYSGTIDAKSACRGIGGIAGKAEYLTTMEDCLFDGSITSKANEAYSLNQHEGINTGVVIGGLCGFTSRVLTITDCMSIGTISIANDTDKAHSGVIFGTNHGTNKLTVSNTYYLTTGSTSGVNAVGTNGASDVYVKPIAITSSWRTIKKRLNNDPMVGDQVNWNIVAPTEYPIPMLNIQQEEVGTYFTISFYDKATEEKLTDIDVLEDDDLVVPAAALKVGHSVTWEPALVSPVKANASYYGTFTVNSYSITYMSEGTQFTQQTYEYGATVTAPVTNPTKTGYVFDHWKNLPATMPALDVTAEAVFAEAPWEISTFEQLKQFRDAVNSAGGAIKNAKLTADIDCNNEDFGAPIGVNANTSSYHTNPTNPYVGTFDGQGHKITGLNINSAGHFVGLFGYAGVGGNSEKEAHIKNLSVSGTINTSFLATESSNCTQSHLGTIGCLMNGTVSGITSSVSLTNTGCTDAHFGGIVGCTYAYASKKTITNCAYTGTMTVDAYDCLGGILGYSQGGVEITNCYFGGKIDQTCTEAKKTLMGGIIGYLSSGTQPGRAFPITNNVSNGTLTVKTTGSGTASNALLNQAGLDKNYINGNFATSGTLADGFGTVKTMTMEEIAAQLGSQWYVENGHLSTGNVISVDAAKNYYLRYLYLDDMADAPTWPSDANSVKVNKVKYVRKGTYMTNGFVSVCMPFALNADNLPGGSECKVKVFDQVKTENGSNVVYFKNADKENDAYAAGVPYFLYLPESARQQEWSVTLTDENGIVLTMQPNNPAAGIIGSFKTTRIGKWSENCQTYKLNKDGDKLLRTAESSDCFPYRAYLKIPQAQSNPAGTYNLSYDDYDEGGNTIPAIEGNDNDAACYNLQGQPVDSNTKGLIISNGKLRMVLH